uniref:C-type lectin domain-containing protein n=1 Tax=Lates calcarifer TaxID=8187 RepID=A0A4W6C420_LATCA
VGLVNHFCVVSNSHCDPGYLLYGDFCYHFETETVKNWQDAEAHCTREQGHLASFHSQEELSFLTGLIQASPVGISLWMGGHDSITEGGWEWTDGSPFRYIHWNPNNHEGREECVEMVSSTNGTSSWWNDLNCDAHQDWICMIAKGKNPIVPPKPPPPLPGKLSPQCTCSTCTEKTSHAFVILMPELF